jgi:two-component system cell cycle response regulator CtrA
LRGEDVSALVVRLLIVEDDSSIAHCIEATCIADRMICHLAEDGVAALEMIRTCDYDAVVLDLMLPDINGFEILARLRSIKIGTPVIVLSGLDTIEDKVRCLTIGADDYITKPFSRIELVARIYAIVRRTVGHFSSLITVGPIEINIKQRCVKVFNVELSLTSKEYAIMELLALKKGAILPKEAFLNHIYGGMDEPEVKIVDVFICRLRKKISDITGGLNFIETVWGRGYTLKTFDEESDEESQVA